MITRINERAGTNVTELVGGTPLLELPSISAEVPGVDILGKAEWYNPGGSVKDRPALWMIRDGEGSDGAIREARRLYAEDPERYYYPDQYSNLANPRSHYESTAPEIWEQTRGEVTHFVAGLGTSGTFVGTATRLKEYNPAIETISFEPDSAFHGLEGMKHMESAIVPAIYDPNIADQNRAVRTEDAYEMVKRVAREDGILIGISAGAAVATALEVAREIESGTVVTILCDGADKYLSERFWEQ
jgi:cysteine synthase B